MCLNHMQTAIVVDNIMDYIPTEDILTFLMKNYKTVKTCFVIQISFFYNF